MNKWIKLPYKPPQCNSPVNYNKKKKTFFKKEKRTADSVPLRPWGPGLVSHPWSLSRLGPRAGLSWGWGRWGACARQTAPHPMDLDRLFPSAGAHSLQIQGTLLQQNQPWCPRRMVGSLGWKRFAKRPGLHGSWWRGSHLQPPSLGSPHWQRTAPSAEGWGNRWDLSGDKGSGRRSKETQPWVYPI